MPMIILENKGKDKTMDTSAFFEELIRKTAHRFPKQIKAIYLRARKYLEQLNGAERVNDQAISLHVTDIILPSIAVYKAVIELTGDQDRAYQIVSRCYEDYFEEKAQKLRDKCKPSIAYPLVTTFAGDFIKKQFSEKDGFVLQNKSKGWKYCQIDIVECPYFSYCKRYGCEELTTAFCDADDIAFEHLHRGISWDRTHTLGRGDDCCDFIISVDE